MNTHTNGDWHRLREPSAWHPVAAAFPLLPKAELSELAEDIRAKGLLNPIVLCDGQVLDGRNRLLACAEAGVDPRFQEWEPNGITPTAWVVSQNLTRRHLTKGQAAACAADVLPLLEAEARERQGTRTDIREKVPESSKGRARDKAATLFKVNSRYISFAKKLKAEAPDLFESVKHGKRRIPAAMHVLRRRKLQIRIEHERESVVVVGNHKEIEAAIQEREELRAEYRKEKRTLEKQHHAERARRLGPIRTAIDEAVKKIMSIIPRIHIREAKTGENHPPLTEDELYGPLLDAYNYRHSSSFYQAPVQELGLGNWKNWALGRSPPTQEHRPWTVRFPDESGRHVTRMFWYPNKWTIQHDSEGRAHVVSVKPAGNA